ncbi:MAG: RagB/SusD family nutrient uptake outer membrane protein, partial [Alistipes sp.]|nr:RagB/SusD family nutrient uptake outer membrane protein [Alistipes sp.]
MKTMKTRILTLLLSFTALGLTSCNDWLELTPTDRVSDKSAWESQQATDLYINNFYEYIAVYGQFGDQQFQGNLTEGLTETFKYGSPILGTRAGDSNHYVFTPETMSSAGSMLDCWTNTYTRVRRINEFLAAMENYSTYTAEVNTLYEAQARFFRAFLYFQLAKRHGGQII